MKISVNLVRVWTLSHCLGMKCVLQYAALCSLTSALMEIKSTRCKFEVVFCLCVFQLLSLLCRGNVYSFIHWDGFSRV
jgi:hypothetical protein